jgi:uncharacterized protein YrrD
LNWSKKPDARSPVKQFRNNEKVFTMLKSLLNTVYGSSLQAKNGEIGNVDDVYFDDKDWKIRYFVTDNSNFLPGRRVLISPASITEIDFERKMIPVSLSKKEIEQSPVVNQGLLPSRDTEIELKSYYNWPVYWGSGYLIGAGDLRRDQGSMRGSKEEIEIDPDLKSCNEVIGYSIESKNRTIGYLHNYVFDEKSWEIRYLVIDTKNWLMSDKKILLAVDWIEKFDWDQSLFITDLKSKDIRESPAYNPGETLKREYESKLFDHYDRRKYWL